MSDTPLKDAYRRIALMAAHRVPPPYLPHRDQEDERALTVTQADGLHCYRERLLRKRWRAADARMLAASGTVMSADGTRAHDPGDETYGPGWPD